MIICETNNECPFKYNCKFDGDDCINISDDTDINHGIVRIVSKDDGCALIGYKIKNL